MSGPDLVEIRAELTSAEDTAIPPLTGRLMRNAIYSLIKDADPALGAPTHKKDPDSSAPYLTCSNLLIPQPVSQVSRPQIRAGAPVMLRVTGLTPGISQLLLNLLQPGQDLFLTCRPLAVHARFSIRAREDRAFTYSDLRHMRKSKEWRIEFQSPTFFSRGTDDRSHDDRILLPLPELIVKGLADRWNSRLPEQYIDELTVNREALGELASQDLLISDIERLQTTDMTEHPGERDVRHRGFLGCVHLQVVGRHEAFRDLNTILHFANLAGVGGGVAEGWGQVRARPI